MKKKNILFIHSGAELYGADKILLEVLKGLDKKLFCPILIIPNGGPLEYELKKNNIKYIIYDFPILRRQYFNLKGIISYTYKYIKSLIYLYRIVKREKIDIICSNTLAVLEGIFLSKISKIPHVWHIHEIIKEPIIMQKFYSIIVPKFAQNAICVSDAVKCNLFKEKHNYKCNIRVIHNGINMEDYKSGDKANIKRDLLIDEDRLIIGMIGRVNKIKGQSFLVDVTKKLVERYPELLVIMVGGVFAGQEDLLINLKEKVKKNNLQSNIKIFDFDNDVNKFYDIFDIFVLPSIKPDSFPTVVLEAMSHGKPIVAHVTGGVSEMVENFENGILITDITIDNTCKAIEKLINNKELRVKYGENSVKIMEKKFSSDIFKERINEFYANIN